VSIFKRDNAHCYNSTSHKQLLLVRQQYSLYTNCTLHGLYDNNNIIILGL